MSNNISVLLPIEVPEGNYCWDYTKEYCICTYFNNEGGHHSCDLNLDSDEDFKTYNKRKTAKGILKPIKCKGLKENNNAS